jgi:hypothetical protein
VNFLGDLRTLKGHGNILSGRQYFGFREFNLRPDQRKAVNIVSIVIEHVAVKI